MRRRSRKKVIFWAIFLLSVLFVAWIFFSLRKVVPVATRIVFHPGATLKETNGRTNVLLLGIGGGSHDGPNLTDTIMLASIDWKANAITLISIPRDLWVPTLPVTVKKINSAYQIGLDNTPPDGLKNAESVVSSVTGQSVDYAIRLDFQGFVDGIDQIGGVDVTVKRTLDDYNYPISGKEDDTCGHTTDELQQFDATASAQTDQDIFDFFPCRYKHLHFDPGPQHMDGETALEFARSRHAAGIEGSDFARSARQQLVIEAVRSKLISSAFFSPQKVIGLYDIVQKSIDTDIQDETLGLFLDKLPQLKTAKIITVNIDSGDYTTGRIGLLMNSPIEAQYDYSAALLPRVGNGNFSEIQQYITCELTKGNCKVTPSPVPTK